MYNKILIPVDMTHTERAPEMIEAAKKLAGEHAGFVLANIVHSVPAVAEMALPKDIFEMSYEEARKKLAIVAKDAGIEAIIEIKPGHPAADILEIAKEQNIDLIIIGSHKPGFQDYLLGSTAARVVRHAQCPVLVMR
ncbi:MAG: universal stress protein [Pseudomonadota bacterium]